MKRAFFPIGKRVLVIGILLLLIAAISCTTTASPSPSATSGVNVPSTSAAISTPPTSAATGTAAPTTKPATSVIPSITPSGGVTPGASASASPSRAATPTGAIGSVEVLGVWGSSEQASFQAMVAPWQQQTGGTMNFTGTRDLTAILTTRIQAGNPPDIAILPNPGLMKQFANAGNLKPLGPMLDMSAINQQYPKTWIDLGSVNNNLYSLFVRAANKSMIWYSPKTFSANSWQIPKTWDDLINLSNNIVSAKKTPANPWAMGVESKEASGWPGTDWIAQIFLTKYGGDLYDQWVNHQIPWTDPRIKDAWNMWGTIVNTPNYVPGGAAAVLATNFQDASLWPFQSPPKAAMYYEGDFVQGFITNQFKSAVAGQDYDYFPFPSISSAGAATPSGTPSASASASPSASASASASTSATVAALPPGPVTGGADLIVAFKDNPTVRSFIAYLATPQAQDIWVKKGGFISVNKQINISDYPDSISQKSVQQLLNASVFRFGAGDSMPAAMQTAWWAGILQYLQNPSQLDSILTSLENTAKTAYSASPSPSGTASAAASPSATASPSRAPTPSSSSY